MVTKAQIKPCFSSPLTLLSWNVAMTQPSSLSDRSTLECTRLISEECLRHRPNVIALQESPYRSWGSNLFETFYSVGTQRSHCGYVDLLLHKDLEDYHRIEFDRSLPSVAASITLPNNAKVAVSSSHLAPFKEGFPQRAFQCNTLMSSLTQECNNCILLGDFNMRAAEDLYIENLCGGWIDSWKSCGSDKSSKFTWNSCVNRFHEGGFQFKARFDRCYTKGDALKLNQFGLVGNLPVRKDDGGSGAGDCLSDHFGMLVRIDVDGRVAEE